MCSEKVIGTGLILFHTERKNNEAKINKGVKRGRMIKKEKKQPFIALSLCKWFPSVGPGHDDPNEYQISS